MSRKRRVTYPPPRSAKGAPPGQSAPLRPPTVAVINGLASKGRAGIEVGMRVTILGDGLYAGEIAVVESLAGGVIPAATVRTQAGGTRRVRTIDLAPVSDDTTRSTRPGAVDGGPAQDA